MRPEALSTNKLSANTFATDLESVTLSGIEILLIISRRWSMTAVSFLSSRSSRVSIPRTAFRCSSGRILALRQHLITVCFEKLAHVGEDARHV